MFKGWLKMAVGYKIFTRESLSGSFTEDTTLDLVRLEKNISPNASQATIKRYTGKWRGTEEGIEQLEKVVVHQDLRGKQFKVEVTDKDDNKDIFYGYCPKTTEVIFGSTNGVRASDDTMIIYGLEYYLQRTEIENSVVLKNNVGEIVKLPLPFNMLNNSGILSGNKADGSLSFGNDLETAEKWDGLSIVRYLLALFKAESGIEYTLDGQHADLVNIQGSFNASGRTFWDMLNEVISPERGFSFYVGTDTDEYKIFVFSTSSTAIGALVPANPNTRSVILDTLHEIQNASVELQEDSHFDRIICKGALIKGTGTFTFSEHFEKGWTTEEEEAYKEATDDVRKSDKFEHVYCRYYLKRDWDGEIKGKNAIPTVDRINKILLEDKKQELSMPLFKFDRNLGILEEGQPKRPFVLAKDSEATEHLLDKPSKDKPGASLFVLSGNRPGIQLRCSIPHLMALNHFTEESKTSPEFDFETVEATLSYNTHEHFAVESSSDELGAFEKTKIIKLPESQFWFVTPETRLSLTETSPDEHQSTVNDVSSIVNFAEMATAWYGKQKAKIGWTYKILKVLDRTGVIITDYTVNSVSNSAESVVSRVVYTFDGQYPETQIQTEQKGIDLRSLVKTRRTSSLNSVSEEVVSFRQQVANIPSREERAIGGGSANLPLLMLTGNSVSENKNEWLGSIIKDRVSKEVITENVTVYAPQTPFIELPTEGDDHQRFWRSVEVENLENIQDALGVDGSGEDLEPPAKIYEISPPGWS